nr:hypothetical protein [Tanacetum cinerariifolium]
MPIPDELISNNIRNAPYYNSYLEMVAKHDRKVAAEKEGKKKTVSAKQTKSKPAVEKSSKPPPASKPKANREKLSKASTTKPPKPKSTKEKSTKTILPEQANKGKILKVRTAKCPFQLVDEPDEEPARFELESELEHQRSDKTSSGCDTEVLKITEELREDVGKQENIKEKTARPDPRESRRALAGPNPEPTHDQFMADLYLKVQESLKFPTDKHVFVEDPISSTGTLSLMKNLEDAFSIGDRSSTVYALPVIDLSPPKPASSITQAPFFTATTLTTTPPLPPPPQQQSLTESELVEQVATLEKKLSTLEQTNKNLDNTIQNLGSRVYTLKLRDLPHKIDEVVQEKRHPWNGHKGTSSMLKDMSRKRRRNDHEPPPPPSESDLNAPPSSSKQQSDPHAEQPVKDLPMPETANISYSEDTDTAHLPKTKQRPEWLKPILDDERTATPKPAWVIPSSHISDAVYNWAKALATMYQALTKNSLLEKTGDIRTFMHGYCQQMVKTELTQADFEGQAYEVDWTNLEGDQVRIDVSKPLPLSGPPGHVTIQAQFFFNHDLDYLPNGSKGIRTHMRILSVVSIKAFSRYRLTKIIEALDYRVKEYKVNWLYPGMNTQFWTDKDVERSKEFIHAIERRLKTRRIF